MIEEDKSRLVSKLDMVKRFVEAAMHLMIGKNNDEFAFEDVSRAFVELRSVYDDFVKIRELDASKEKKDWEKLS
jgi:hypothetical protein